MYSKEAISWAKVRLLLVSWSESTIWRANDVIFLLSTQWGPEMASEDGSSSEDVVRRWKCSLEAEIKMKVIKSTSIHLRMRFLKQLIKIFFWWNLENMPKIKHRLLKMFFKMHRNFCNTKLFTLSEIYFSAIFLKIDYINIFLEFRFKYMFTDIIIEGFW